MHFHLIFISLLLTTNLQAQTTNELNPQSPQAPTAVTSDEYETVVEDVIFNSSSRVVIDEKTIKESKAPDVISLITTQANVTLFNNNFQPPQLFLRGGESSHILFLIDGIPTYDVSWAQRTMNLNSLDLSNIKRIEIIKGGQTVLHGGQALAGVIKIETFGGQYQNEKRVAATTSLTEKEDYRLGLSLEKAMSEKSGFKANVRLMDKKNESPIQDSNKLYDQSNKNLDLNYERQGAVTFRTRGFYFLDRSKNPTTINGATGQSITDSDIVRQDEQLGISGQLLFNQVALKPKLSLFGQKGWRFFYSPPNSQSVDAKFRSQLQGALLDLTAFENSITKISAGLSYQKEDFFLDDSQATLSPAPRTADVFSELRGAYIMAQLIPHRNFKIEAGTRTEKATGFSEQQSYQVGFTIFENTKLEWVTGYRAPSSAQKYGVFQNPDLEPETSQTYSLTQDVKLSDGGEASVTLFETSFDDYIETQSAGMGILEYANTAKVKTRGVEFAASYLLNPKENIQLSYAYQEPWDQVRHEQLRRRPRVSGSLRFFHFEEKYNWMLEGVGVGQRNDFFRGMQTYRYQFPGYFLLNAAYTYYFLEKMSLALRVSNILDFRPEISIDFYGEGRNAWLTFEYRW